MIHNHEVTGSIPVPATKDVLFGRTNLIGAIFFCSCPTILRGSGHRVSSEYSWMSGCVVETRSLLIELWGNDNYLNTRSLHVFITKLRHHLRRDTSIRIINVRGIGYKMVCPPSVPLH